MSNMEIEVSFSNYAYSWFKRRGNIFLMVMAVSLDSPANKKISPPGSRSPVHCGKFPITERIGLWFSTLGRPLDGMRLN